MPSNEEETRRPSTESEPGRNNAFLVIPSSAFLDPDLRGNTFMLLCHIVYRMDEHRCVRASNAELAEAMGLKDRDTISVHLGKLRKKGLIKTTQSRKGKLVIDRRIYLTIPDTEVPGLEGGTRFEQGTLPGANRESLYINKSSKGKNVIRKIRQPAVGTIPEDESEPEGTPENYHGFGSSGWKKVRGSRSGNLDLDDMDKTKRKIANGEPLDHFDLVRAFRLKFEETGLGLTTKSTGKERGQMKNFLKENTHLDYTDVYAIIGYYIDNRERLHKLFHLPPGTLPTIGIMFGYLNQYINETTEDAEDPEATFQIIRGNQDAIEGG